MTEKDSPQKWAFKITNVLNTVLGNQHFPIIVKDVAQEYSKQLYPDDPITLVKGGSLPGFEGCLAKAPSHKKGWGIFYNEDIESKGRINFTLAHEFGHYLQHRIAYPDGINCGEKDLYRWGSEYRQIEHQANVFAANLLMPLDDYRREIPPNIDVDFDLLSNIAEKYGVSLLAAALRWIDYTERSSILVLSRDQFMMWGRSSSAAYKRGHYIKTAGHPVPIPVQSIAGQPNNFDIDQAKAGVHMPSGIWLKSPCKERSLFSEQYDFTVTLLDIH